MHKHFEINAVGRDFVIGDLHGHYDLLVEKMRDNDFNKEYDRMFSVGDLIDRGPKNLECLQLIDEPWFHAVLGNHEDMMLDVMINGIEPWLWDYNGGAWHHKVDQHELYRLVKLAKYLPHSITVETNSGSFGICHAQPPSSNWDDVKEPTEKDIKNMLWSRDIVNRHSFMTENIDFTIHGHTPLNDISHVGNCIFIDTGAFFTENLTMINVDSIEIETEAAL